MNPNVMITGIVASTLIILTSTILIAKKNGVSVPLELSADLGDGKQARLKLGE